MKRTYCAILIVTCLQISEGRDSKWTQRLNELTNKKFTQGQSELVFLLDRSGSVGPANFEIEKGFVENMLTHFSVIHNGTRVAVVTYSKKAVRHIDYIKDPKNKCFLSEELQKIRYEESRETNTAAALMEARLVFRNGRKNVNKVIILLSDGMSTAGKNPVEVAKILKKENVEIYTFAIGKFLRIELDAIATNPSHTFNAASFKEFSKLARRIRGDPHELKWDSSVSKKSCEYLCDNPYAGEKFDPGCCDGNAKCTCGLISGLYNCACGPGFYGESGLKGECTECPRGTYKDSYKPTYECTRCPSKSTTTYPRSTSIGDCRCIDGYRGQPHKGEACRIKKCSPLQAPRNGKIIGGSCQRKYGSTCFFDCDSGYQLSDMRGQERTCEADGTWSGVTTTCTKVRCQNLETPTSGLKKCTTKDNGWGSVCDFQCRPGHKIVGSKSRLCGPGGQWSGFQPECQVVTCPVLFLKNGRLNPPSCYNERKKYNEPCFFNCYRGFSIVRYNYTICNAQGVWEGRFPDDSVGFKIPYCKDVERPRFVCPPQKIVKTEPGTNFAWVSWKQPEAWDNSGLPPKVQWRPNYRKNKVKFEIGEHEIHYKASDGQLLTSVCIVKIRVVDREPPVVLTCPEDIQLNTTELEEKVFWKEPELSDNSGKDLSILSSNKPGDVFQVGKWNILYLASDASGNEATCQFDVIVNKNTCPFYPEPVNGALTCNDWLRGQFCQVYCNERFEFARRPANWYICGKESVWKTIPANHPLPWPDCSEWHIPKASRKMIGFYYTGSCDDPRVQNAIKRTFLKHFERKFDSSKYCRGSNACKIDGVKVKCGQINETLVARRQKRDLRNLQGYFEIEIDFVIQTDSKDPRRETVVRNLLKASEDIMKETQIGKENLKIELDDRETVIAEEIDFVKREVELTCDSGQIQRENECVNCPVGTFYDEPQKICKICPTGRFQDEEAKLNCKKCPDGSWTVGEHNRNFTECKEICKLGTYSKTGLATCKSCPRGTYQDREGMSSCRECPRRTTTWTTGAINITYCGEKCEPGKYSDTGLHPCRPCPKGYYQHLYGQQQCTECPAKSSTVKNGADSMDSCRKVDHCASNPCQNGGMCEDTQHGYGCVCTDGFYGHDCNNETDECASSPCMRNSSCIDKVGGYDCVCSKGYTGKNCQDEIDECYRFPCINGGTCSDEVAGYHCFCTEGYSGQRCQIDLDLCENHPCGLHGTCADLGDSIRCDCNPGFKGERCEINVNECSGIKCRNGGSCQDSINNYTCNCLAGFQGRNCEGNVNDCIENECKNGATCKDELNDYTCVCPPGYRGKLCDETPAVDFYLSFKRPKLSDYVMLERMPILRRITIDMWIQSVVDNRRSGTIVSYATKHGGTLVDNAFTVADQNSLKVFVNNEKIFTDIEVDDGYWHRITFSWTMNQGKWSVYLNGSKHQTGDGISVGRYINGDGLIVLGQEQDSLGGNFNILESFVGNLTRINIWSRVLTPLEIGNTCSDNFTRSKSSPNVKAWPDYLAAIHGDIEIVDDTCP